MISSSVLLHICMSSEKHNEFLDIFFIGKSAAFSLFATIWNSFRTPCLPGNCNEHSGASVNKWLEKWWEMASAHCRRHRLLFALVVASTINVHRNTSLPQFERNGFNRFPIPFYISFAIQWEDDTESQWEADVRNHRTTGVGRRL